MGLETASTQGWVPQTRGYNAVQTYAQSHRQVEMDEVVIVQVHSGKDGLRAKALEHLFKALKSSGFSFWFYHRHRVQSLASRLVPDPTKGLRRCKAQHCKHLTFKCLENHWNHWNPQSLTSMAKT